MIVRVSAFSDPRLDDYRNVPDPELLRARGIFVAEGRLVVRRLLESSRFRARSLLVTPAAHEALADAIEPFPDLPVYVVTQDTMNEVTGFNIHRGCLAVGERPATLSWMDVARGASLLVILDRVSNADNVGGIFRSAEAFGADAVLLERSSTDPLYRKAIRTSMGAALSIPFARIDAWPEALRVLREDGALLVGLTPGEHAPTLADTIASFRDRRVAFVVGHEGEGLTREATQACNVLARIPMANGVDSLNVATATAIALYELARAGGPPEGGSHD